MTYKPNQTIKLVFCVSYPQKTLADQVGLVYTVSRFVPYMEHIYL